jgi:hypothetical protein
MPGELRPSQRHLPHEVPRVQRIGGGIEAATERDRAHGQTLAERFLGGAVGQKRATDQLVDQAPAGAPQGL